MWMTCLKSRQYWISDAYYITFFEFLFQVSSLNIYHLRSLEHGADLFKRTKDGEAETSEAAKDLSDSAKQVSEVKDEDMAVDSMEEASKGQCANLRY